MEDDYIEQVVLAAQTRTDAKIALAIFGWVFVAVIAATVGLFLGK